MKNPRKLLRFAAEIALLKRGEFGKSFYFGAIAIRSDDTKVFASNGAPAIPVIQHHCEARIVRKLDRGATVYLARVLANGTWANSTPCPDCRRALKRAYVKRVYYTIGPDEWACIRLS